jgi:hypothetical protein
MIILVPYVRKDINGKRKKNISSMDVSNGYLFKSLVVVFHLLMYNFPLCACAGQ